jgi:CheY-like chemotaxis protein
MNESRTVQEIQLSERCAATKVLHIEDDPCVAKSIARALRLAGVEVVSAATREEAINHVEVHGFRPDVIITDLHLGGGLTSKMVVAELAVRLKSNPPTILLSGSAGQWHPSDMPIADRVLSKPADIVALLRAISDLHGMKSARPGP